MRLADAGSWYVIDEIDLVGLIVDHSDLSRICEELEALADRLPERPTKALLVQLGDRLDTLLARHDGRERRLFEGLLTVGSLPGTDRALLAYIRQRRAEWIVQGQDVVSALRADAAWPCAETLGYMIRCFFQSCRQAITFEEFAVLSLGAGRFTPAAAIALRTSLRARCRA